jgi:hypothetical protein
MDRIARELHYKTAVARARAVGDRCRHEADLAIGHAKRQMARSHEQIAAIADRVVLAQPARSAPRTDEPLSVGTAAATVASTVALRSLSRRLMRRRKVLVAARHALFARMRAQAEEFATRVSKGQDLPHDREYGR